MGRLGRVHKTGWQGWPRMYLWQGMEGLGPMAYHTCASVITLRNYKGVTKNPPQKTPRKWTPFGEQVPKALATICPPKRAWQSYAWYMLTPIMQKCP